MSSQDFLNFTVGIFFAVLVVGVLFVLYRLYQTLGDADEVIKESKTTVKNANEASENVKEITQKGKDVISEISSLGSVAKNVINRFTKSKRRKK